MKKEDPPARRASPPVNVRRVHNIYRARPRTQKRTSKFKQYAIIGGAVIFFMYLSSSLLDEDYGGDENNENLGNLSPLKPENTQKAVTVPVSPSSSSTISESNNNKLSSSLAGESMVASDSKKAGHDNTSEDEENHDTDYYNREHQPKDGETSHDSSDIPKNPYAKMSHGQDKNPKSSTTGEVKDFKDDGTSDESNTDAEKKDDKSADESKSETNDSGVNKKTQPTTASDESNSDCEKKVADVDKKTHTTTASDESNSDCEKKVVKDDDLAKDNGD